MQGTLFAAPGADHDAAEEARLLGIPPGLSAALLASSPGHGRGVWPENVALVEAWLDICTQWRVAPMGGFVGLDYTAVRTGLEAAGRTIDATLWHALRVMEAEAARALNER